MFRIIQLSIVLTLTLFVLLTGCYNKSIRHLASDASLIKVGSSNRNDVLTYLGEPDGTRILGEGQEEWVYIEEKPSDYQRAPVVGKYFDGDGFDKIFLVLENDIVQSIKFREFDEDEFNWANEPFWKFW